MELRVKGKSIKSQSPNNISIENTTPDLSTNLL
jgi:hypothetical protein